MQLSSATMDRIKTRPPLSAEQTESPGKKKPRRVISWACPECDELHDDEHGAEECCSPPPSKPGAEIACPVCGQPWASFRGATDCCLWKDLAPPDRWAIADRVEAGATWETALGISSH
jgi:hypothetical protein